MNCTAHKTKWGLPFRCNRPYKHKGNHRWAKDEGIYPFGRLNPDDPFDQMFVNAWNRGARRDRSNPS